MHITILFSRKMELIFGTKCSVVETDGERDVLMVEEVGGRVADHVGL